MNSEHRPWREFQNSTHLNSHLDGVQFSEPELQNRFRDDCRNDLGLEASSQGGWEELTSQPPWPSQSLQGHLWLQTCLGRGQSTTLPSRASTTHLPPWEALPTRTVIEFPEYLGSGHENPASTHKAPRAPGWGSEGQEVPYTAKMERQIQVGLFLDSNRTLSLSPKSLYSSLLPASFYLSGRAWAPHWLLGFL